MLQYRSQDIRERVRPASEEESRQARADLAALSRPRMTGTDGATEVEAQLRSELEGLGYTLQELPFEFSAWPGRFGLPAIAGLLLATVLAGTALLLLGSALAGVIVVAVGLLLVAALAALAPGAIQWLPFGRQQARNLLALPGSGRPRYIVAAHRDTKSQAVPTLYRAAAMLIAGGGAVFLLLLGLLGLVAPAVLWKPLVLIVAGLTAIGAGVLLFCWAGNHSPGALDNASGLAALLGVARRERGANDVAFLLTDAEELGLAGATAAVPVLPPVIGLINMDGLDDHGPFHLIERHGWPRAKGIAPHMAATMLAAADALALPLERRNLPFGLLVDHVAYVRGGLPAITLMRGTSRSLQRVHRAQDSLEHLSGDGVQSAIALVAGAIALLRVPPLPPQKIARGSLVAPRSESP
ncbi:MAG: M28 family metallopeptidase [Longimicrobiales bacterium]